MTLTSSNKEVVKTRGGTRCARWSSHPLEGPRRSDRRVSFRRRPLSFRP